jgi:hypothetical protein
MDSLSDPLARDKSKKFFFLKIRIAVLCSILKKKLKRKEKFSAGG